jgi:hypothetical protein
MYRRHHDIANAQLSTDSFVSIKSNGVLKFVWWGCSLDVLGRHRYRAAPPVRGLNRASDCHVVSLTAGTACASIQLSISTGWNRTRWPTFTYEMRRSAMSRRMCRSDVPSIDAASSIVINGRRGCSLDDVMSTDPPVRSGTPTFDVTPLCSTGAPTIP